MQAKARRISETRAAAFPERSWGSPALRILSNSHALGSRRGSHTARLPLGVELQELCSSILLPTATPSQHARPIPTSDWKMEINRLPGNNPGCLQSSSPESFATEKQRRLKDVGFRSLKVNFGIPPLLSLPPPYTHILHHISLLPLHPPLRGRLQSSSLPLKLGIANGYFISHTTKHQEWKWIC
jgi:hypothetical protein